MHLEGIRYRLNNATKHSLGLSKFVILSFSPPGWFLDYFKYGLSPGCSTSSIWHEMFLSWRCSLLLKSEIEAIVEDNGVQKALWHCVSPFCQSNSCSSSLRTSACLYLDRIPWLCRFFISASKEALKSVSSLSS